ncbi:undecaprenyl diphosphate synthase family protein [Methylocystis sp.]|uniref:undecaprenyl diphosphate synthase family protein n=1 Tax=Methylocystis sp. TaxID=1911079 RepID=UPI003D0B199D
MNIPMLSMLTRGHSTGSTPSHVALIAEGIEGWATKQDIDYCRTLRQSIGALRCAANAAIRFKIPYLTIDFRSATRYFSGKGASKLFQIGLEEWLHDLSVRGANIRVKGSEMDFASSKIRKIDNENIEIFLCLECDSRKEIVEAVRRLAREVVSGEIQANNINVNKISEKISPLNLPDPDLIIGMSRDQSLSNFLLWQAAYAEFYFLPIDWPDFGEADFEMAIQDYARRHRRFGGR